MAMLDILEEARRTLAESVLKIGQFDDFRILRHEALPSWVFILRDCSSNQHWRIQRFDKDGFVGHEIYQTKEIAINAAARERHVIQDDDALDRLEKTPSFRLGNEITAIRDLLNGGLIKWDDYLQRVRKLKEGYSF